MEISPKAKGKGKGIGNQGILKFINSQISEILKGNVIFKFSNELKWIYLKFYGKGSRFEKKWSQEIKEIKES